MQGGPGPSIGIRIHSDRKAPELVVLDSRQPKIVPAEIANAEPSVPSGTDRPQAPAREAFAQVQSLEAGRPQLRQSVKTEAKPQRQNKIARRHTERRIRLVARPPQYGWFGDHVW